MAQMAALSRPGLQFILRGTRKVDICLVLVAIHTTAFAHIGGEYPPNFGAGMSGTCQVQADGEWFIDNGGDPLYIASS